MPKVAEFDKVKDLRTGEVLRFVYWHAYPRARYAVCKRPGRSGMVFVPDDKLRKVKA